MANIKGSNYDKPRFSVAIRSEAYQKLINDTLGDKTAAMKFTADITSAVANNYMLASCDAGTILTAGLQAQRLNLPLTTGLGFVYLVPYGNKAQFQLSYKGFIQLAQRSGQFEKLGVKAVHKGELKGYDEFGDELVQFDHKYDAEETIGYFAYFKLLNGFKKTLYWTKDQCLDHAKKYSKSYGNGSTTDLWTNSFDTMASKTVLKQLLSKYAPLSTELQQAIISDQAVIEENGSYNYIDGTYQPEEIAHQELKDDFLNEEEDKKEEIKDSNNNLFDL